MIARTSGVPRQFRTVSPEPSVRYQGGARQFDVVTDAQALTVADEPEPLTRADRLQAAESRERHMACTGRNVDLELDAKPDRCCRSDGGQITEIRRRTVVQ